jgi:hypothetical protein
MMPVRSEAAVIGRLKRLANLSVSGAIRSTDPRLLALELRHPAIRDVIESNTLRKDATDLMAKIGAGALGAASLSEVASWADEVYAWVVAGAGEPLERAASGLLYALGLLSSAGGRGIPLNDMWTDIMRTRWGLDGQLPTTLDKAAAKYGLTRERVRQVESALLKARTVPAWIPALDRAISLAKVKGRTRDAFAEELVEAGIAEQAWHPEALNKLASVAGRANRIEFEGGIVGLDSGAVKLIREHVKAPCTNPGVGVVENVVVELRNLMAREGRSGGDAVNGQSVRAIVEATGSLAWLDEDRTAFFDPAMNPDRVRLRNCARKMLSVAEKLTATEILEGLKRKCAGRSEHVHLATKHVAAFLEKHPEFNVSDGRVSLVDPLDYRVANGRETARFIDVFRQFPGYVSDRPTILAAAEAHGVNKASAGTWLTFSEVVADYGWGVWGLVGANPSPAAVRAIQERLRASFESPEVDTGWDEAGRPWLQLRVTSSLFSYGSIPFVWHDFLKGRKFAAETADGKAAGYIAFGDTHNFVWGWSAVLHALSASRGSFLRAVFDLETDQVVVSIFK